MNASGHDGSLSNVPSERMGNSTRTLTPSKVLPRQGTPQRGNSAPRNGGSNGRGVVRTELGSNLVSTTGVTSPVPAVPMPTNRMTPQSDDKNVVRRASSRSTSRRKQRQWDNQHFFGIEDLKAKEARIREALENEDEDEVNAGALHFEVSWRSTLSQMLKPENQVLLQDFLSCREFKEDATSTSSKSKLMKKKEYWQRYHKRHMDMSTAAGSTLALADIAADWADCELAWLNMEKKVRTAMSTAFSSSDVIRTFLFDIEQLLLYFIHTKQAPPIGYIPDTLKRDLVAQSSITVVAANKNVPVVATTAATSVTTTTSSSSISSSGTGDDADTTNSNGRHTTSAGQLVIPLVDSPFRRLLVHGVAQFYGLQSKSVKGKKAKQKSCIVYLPRSGANSNCSSGATGPTSRLPDSATRCLSLVKFLAHSESLSLSAATTNTNTNTSDAAGAAGAEPAINNSNIGSTTTCTSTSAAAPTSSARGGGGGILGGEKGRNHDETIGEGKDEDNDKENDKDHSEYTFLTTSAGLNGVGVGDGGGGGDASFFLAEDLQTLLPTPAPAPAAVASVVRPLTLPSSDMAFAPATPAAAVDANSSSAGSALLLSLVVEHSPTSHTLMSHVIPSIPSIPSITPHDGVPVLPVVGSAQPPATTVPRSTSSDDSENSFVVV